MGAANSTSASPTDGSPPMSGAVSGSRDLSDCIRNLPTSIPGSSFFDRQDELKELLKILARPGTSMTIITGPKNSGKSRLLTHLRDLWNRPDLVRTPGTPQIERPGQLSPYILINLGMHDCSSPDLLAQQFRVAVAEWSSTVLAILKTVPRGTKLMDVPIGEIVAGIHSFFNGFREQTGLGQIQTAVALFLAKNLRVKPILVLDEANMLLDWDGRYDRELSALFRFFETMTKECQRLHVVMASSDAFFQDKLVTRLTGTNFRVFAIGHLGKHDARSFLESRLTQAEQHQTQTQQLEDPVWDVIYGLVGGCPSSLERIVEDSDGELSNLVPAAKELVSLVRGGLEAFLELHPDVQELCVDLFKLLVEKAGYLHLDDFKTEFANKVGAAEVRRLLLEKNFIHLRHVTYRSVFNDMESGAGEGTYIMAASPTTLAAMAALASNPAT